MRHFICFLIFLLPSVSHSGWTYIASSSDGSDYFVDFASIAIFEGKLKAWVKSNHPPRETFQSSRIAELFDCVNERSRELDSTYFNGPDFKGGVRSSNGSQSEWQYHAPNTIFYAVLKAVCKAGGK